MVGWRARLTKSLGGRRAVQREGERVSMSEGRGNNKKHVVTKRLEANKDKQSLLALVLLIICTYH